MPVEAGRVPVLRCPAGRNQSHRGLFSDVALESDHTEILARYGVAFLGLSAEYPQGILANPAAEFRAPNQVNRFAVIGNADPPAEKGDNHQRPRGRGQTVHRKIGRILQKELPLFGEKEGKARQIDLHIVRFGLGKVGIERQAERQAGGGFVEQVKARLKGRSIATHLGGHKRRKIEPQTLGPVAQSGESARARDPVEVQALEVAAPDRFLVHPFDDALDVKTPARLSRSIAEGLKRNFKFRAPAAR